MTARYIVTGHVTRSDAKVPGFVLISKRQAAVLLITVIRNNDPLGGKRFFRKRGHGCQSFPLCSSVRLTRNLLSL